MKNISSEEHENEEDMSVIIELSKEKLCRREKMNETDYDFILSHLILVYMRRYNNKYSIFTIKSNPFINIYIII